MDTVEKKPRSMIELLVCRKEVLRSKRLRIGLLSSRLLEAPEQKAENFRGLLELMEETNPEVYITVRKLATVSLLEIFKDLLPSYTIFQLQQEGVKCMQIISNITNLSRAGFSSRRS